MHGGVVRLPRVFFCVDGRGDYRYRDIEGGRPPSLLWNLFFKVLALVGGRVPPVSVGIPSLYSVDHVEIIITALVVLVG